MFHYLFPILTMGLWFLIALLSTFELTKGDQRYGNAARLLAKIFIINFALGVVTGLPLEFELGTNWSRFSSFGGGVFGQTLPLEGVYAFFCRSDDRDRGAFRSSTPVIAGLMGSAAASVYPNPLTSTFTPAYSLTNYNAASSPLALRASLIANLVGMVGVAV